MEYFIRVKRICVGMVCKNWIEADNKLGGECLVIDRRCNGTRDNDCYDDGPETSTMMLQLRIGKKIEIERKKRLRVEVEENLRKLLDAMGFEDVEIKWKPFSE